MKRLLLLALLSLPSSLAQNVLNVATGGPTGTYTQIFKNMGDVCAGASWLKEVHTGGSIDNVDMLLGNKVSLAFAQVDVLKARAQIDGDTRVNEIRALLPLYDEEIHVLALTPKKTGGVLGIGAKMTGVTKFSELGGKRVGAWGGSVVTARVMSAMGGVKYSVVPLQNQAAGLAALAGGQVDALIAVVGQPASWIADLDPARFALIPVDVSGKLADFYHPAKLIYPKFGAGVPTYAVQSVLATRNFKSADKKKLLLAYQNCVESKLTDLQENEGMHPKWQDVTFKNSAWPLYK